MSARDHYILPLQCLTAVVRERPIGPSENGHLSILASGARWIKYRKDSRLCRPKWQRRQSSSLH